MNKARKQQILAWKKNPSCKLNTQAGRVMQYLITHEVAKYSDLKNSSITGVRSSATPGQGYERVVVDFNTTSISCADDESCLDRSFLAFEDSAFSSFFFSSDLMFSFADSKASDFTFRLLSTIKWAITNSSLSNCPSLFISAE
jgi:hypothetical protein